MGHYAFLELWSTAQIGPDDPDTAVLVWEAKNALPFAWLSLLEGSDIQTVRPPSWSTWSDDVRAAYADPETSGIPPLVVPWADAHRRVQRAHAHLDARQDDWAPAYRRWSAALESCAAEHPALEVRLDLGQIANFYDTADAYLESVWQGMTWWQGDAGWRPALGSEAELIGVLESTTTAARHTPGHGQQRGRCVRTAVLVALLIGTIFGTLTLTHSLWWAWVALLVGSLIVAIWSFQ